MTNENSTKLGFSPNRIRTLDGLTTLLLAAFLLYSCGAKQAPREIKVVVPADFSGEVKLDPRTTGMTAEVTLSYSEVTIERAGDGLPVAIKAHIH